MKFRTVVTYWVAGLLVFLASPAALPATPISGTIPQYDDISGGVLIAVPTPAGKSPTIDGSFNGWDLSGMQSTWNSPNQTTRFHANVALMYDENAIYVGAEISLPGRKLDNPNNPGFGYWNGDLLQFRLV